jgi:hypothetical protein
MPAIGSVRLARNAELLAPRVAPRLERRRSAHTTGANGTVLLECRFYGCLVPHLYNHHRPHSALSDRTPAEFAAGCSRGKGGDETGLEDAARLPLSHRTATAAIVGKDNNSSTLLLEALT